MSCGKLRSISPVAKQFNSWFSTTMGTGIVGILLNTIPFQARWLYYLSIVFFLSNTILFFSAFTISVLRYALYPEIWGVMIRDPVNSLFLGTIPMGFATLIDMWIYICIPAWGPWAATVVWIAWMVDAVLSAGVTLSMSVLLYVFVSCVLTLSRAHLDGTRVISTLKPPIDVFRRWLTFLECLRSTRAHLRK